MARIVLPAQQGHDEENGGKKVCDEGGQTGEIASERLCLNGAFIFDRPCPSGKPTAEGFDGVASESLDGAARGRGASS